jgi:leader peptidase (prepilin peptidase)/N-methyltransferase
MTVTWLRRVPEWGTALVLAGFVLVMHGMTPACILPLYLAAVSPALCTADLVDRRLPNRLVIPGYGVAVSAIALGWITGDRIAPTAGIAGVLYFAFLLALSVLGGMGMGDVKLAGVLGLAAGGLGAVPALASTVIAFAVGTVAALVALVRRTGRSIPFGPCLLAGFWSAALLF